MKAAVKDDVIKALKVATGVDVSRGDLELIVRLIQASKRKHRMASDVAKSDRVQGSGVVEFGGIPVAYGQTKVGAAMIAFAGRAARQPQAAEVDTTAQQVEEMAKAGACTGFLDCVCINCEEKRKAYREELAKTYATADKCTHNHNCICARCEFYRNSMTKAVKCRCSVCRNALILARGKLTTITEIKTFDTLHGNINDEFTGHDKFTCMCADCVEERRNAAPE